MCKKLIKNSQPFGKKFQNTVEGDFLTHTVWLIARKEKKWLQEGTRLSRVVQMSTLSNPWNDRSVCNVYSTAARCVWDLVYRVSYAERTKKFEAKHRVYVTCDRTVLDNLNIACSEELQKTCWLWGARNNRYTPYFITTHSQTPIFCIVSRVEWINGTYTSREWVSEWIVS